MVCFRERARPCMAGSFAMRIRSCSCFLKASARKPRRAMMNPPRFQSQTPLQVVQAGTLVEALSCALHRGCPRCLCHFAHRASRSVAKNHGCRECLVCTKRVVYSRVQSNSYISSFLQPPVRELCVNSSTEWDVWTQSCYGDHLKHKDSLPWTKWSMGPRIFGKTTW